MLGRLNSRSSSSSRGGCFGKAAEDGLPFGWPAAQGRPWAESPYAKWALGLVLCALLASAALVRGLGRRSAELEKELREAARAGAASAARVKELDAQLARRFEVEDGLSEKVTRHYRAGEERRQVLAAGLSQLEERLSEHDAALQRKLEDQSAALHEHEKQASRLGEELSMERYHSEDLEGQLGRLKSQLNSSGKHLAALQAEIAKHGGEAKLEAKQLAAERSAAAKLKAELGQQKRSVALLSTEVAREQQSLVEQKELRASDIKTALDRLQSAEATNKALVAKLAKDSEVADAAARTYDKRVQELAGRLESAEARAQDLAGRLALRQQEDAAPPHPPAPAAAAGLFEQGTAAEQVDQVQYLRDELAALESGEIRLGRKRGGRPAPRAR